MKRAGTDGVGELRYMRALVALQVAAMTDPKEVPRPEVLLHRAGLEIAEIAQLVGKTYLAVAKTISRERLSRGR